MSSSICPHFTQNAWKKDLCSNCFKSKDEHKQAAAAYAAGKSFSFATSKRHNISSVMMSRSEMENKKTDYHDFPNKNKTPTKSIIKKKSLSKPTKGKAHKVSFPKNLSEVIGYGGEWSDNGDSDDDDHDFMNLANERDENAATSTDDEETLDLKRITRANTDFNMNNGNLLGDPQENIKKSFAALKLGAPQVDKEGKKQTLKISVVPFGATAPTSSNSDSAKSKVTMTTTAKASFETKTETITKQECQSATKTTTTTIKSQATQQSNNSLTKKSTTATSTTAAATKTSTSFISTAATTTQVKIDAMTSDTDGKNSPPIERAMEKSLLDEISETLELQQNESKKLTAEKEAAANVETKIKFEITSLTETLENKTFLDLKKPIARNAPITKEHTKPKINVFHKYSDSESNCSDTDGVSAYYDVVETQVSYENLPDGKCSPTETQVQTAQDQSDNSDTVFSSSQYITDMLLSSKTRAASYNLHEGNFMTSKITSDGLIVTKCSSDDALDSTGSSFDGSSDEETSYNMTRSESDSGIGISIGNDYKNIIATSIPEQERERESVEKKLSASNNNSDYEDIQVTEHAPAVLQKAEQAATLKSPANLRKPTFVLDKSRELHGEPDGSADPDGSLENKERATVPTQLPALPKSPPPTKIIDARPSFLHGLQKQHPPILLKKPDLPAKPIVSPVHSPLKTFTNKRQPTSIEQQVISQLQLVMSKSNENLIADSAKDDAKLKKGRAPNPPPEHKTSAPPTPERDYNIAAEFTQLTEKKDVAVKEAEIPRETKTEQHSQSRSDESANSKIIDFEAKKSSTTTMEVDKNTDQHSAVASNTSMSTTTTPPAPSAVTSSAASNIYTRKLAAAAATASNNTKNNPAPVVREKDKRERATINPKFRSLNTFVSQRNNAAKNLLLLQPMTPEPKPRTNSLSMSEECLAPTAETTATFVSASNIDLTTSPAPGDKKSPTTPTTPTIKTKTKFSIKKFLRMGKTTENINKKEGGTYSEICTGEESGVVGKPRLVIIHPIDINTTGVEVVKDITKTNDAVAAQTIAVITAKPPAPPLRATDGQRAHEINKPARPPPPKSAELRRKQKIGLSDNGLALSAALETASTGGSLKCKADNVYANLGEIRSSIAPRKPERTASMREREAQLELARKRHAGQHNENVDTISICSSNGENVLAEQEQHQQQLQNNNNKNTVTTLTLSPQLSSSGRVTTLSSVDGKPPTGSSRTSTFERKKSDPKIATKLEIFENLAATPTTTSANNNSNTNTANGDSRPSSLKDSVRKINSTIDSYLKDKRDFENMYEFVKTAVLPPPPPTRTVDLATVQRNAAARRAVVYSDTASVASYTRSEYGPVRSYGLNNSLANIPRVISASYCGSEVGEFDIYSPYSYYGSEAGGDVATDINDSVWGIPSALKNRTKATNRLRMRKGRSVVHKTIEDNYTAVVVANHEALAQVLDQLQQTPIVPPALRPLANAINLRFEDFTILDGAQAFVVGKKAFHAALWTNAPVTLALSADSNQLAGAGGELTQLSGGVCDVLNPITEFCDLVPSYHLPLMPSTEVLLLQATISVLPRLQLDTLQSIGTILKGKSQVLDKSNFNFRGSIPNLAGLKDVGGVVGGSNALRNVVSVQNLSTLNEGESMDKGTTSVDSEPTIQGMPAFDDVMTREVTFIMLQLVNGMKNLQVKAIEEMPLSLSNVVLSKDVENKDAQARLCVLQGNNNDEDEPMGTLCKCAHIALSEMLPPTKITPLLSDILLQERSESLSKSKSVLEFVLWGPSDVVLSGSTKERELALQRWLDLERATVLHGLVRTRVELTVYDECHLMFLVRSNAKMMNDAAKIVCSFQQPVVEKE